MIPGELHVALRRPETMKRTCAIIRADERKRQVVSYLSFELVGEPDPSRIDAPETVSPARAGRTLGRMPPIVLTPANSSCDAWFKSLMADWSSFADELRHSTEPGNWAATGQRPKADRHPRKKELATKNQAALLTPHSRMQFAQVSPLFGGLG